MITYKKADNAIKPTLFSLSTLLESGAPGIYRDFENSMVDILIIPNHNTGGSSNAIVWLPEHVQPWIGPHGSYSEVRWYFLGDAEIVLRTATVQKD